MLINDKGGEVIHKDKIGGESYDQREGLPLKGDQLKFEVHK